MVRKFSFVFSYMRAHLFSVVSQNVIPHCLNIHLLGLCLVLVMPLVLCHNTTQEFFVIFFLGILTNLKIIQLYLVLFQANSLS